MIIFILIMKTKDFKFGIVRFPGSNCDYDTIYATNDIMKCQSDILWHAERKNLKNYDCIILPGGFSFGDYLRSGAISQFSAIMENVIDFAKNGGYVIGICNGFQILLESDLLPGIMMKNESHKFICKHVHLKCENKSTKFTKKVDKDILKIPIAHFEGNYFAKNEVLEELKSNGQIVFKYCEENGDITENSNPNGSKENIAGIINKKGNVLGMMPHPERAMELLLGSDDGFKIFESIIA